MMIKIKKEVGALHCTLSPENVKRKIMEEVNSSHKKKSKHRFKIKGKE